MQSPHSKTNNSRAARMEWCLGGPKAAVTINISGKIKILFLSSLGTSLGARGAEPPLPTRKACGFWGESPSGVFKWESTGRGSGPPSGKTQRNDATKTQQQTQKYKNDGTKTKQLKQNSKKNSTNLNKTHNTKTKTNTKKLTPVPSTPI